MRMSAKNWAALSVALISISLPAVATGTQKTAVPDFAYPADVAAKARSEMLKALSAGQPRQALEAAVKLSIAGSLIDNAQVKAELSLLDSVAQAMPAPWQGIGRLLEAQLLDDVYQSQGWVADNRTLPLEPLTADPTSWSRGQFARQVTALVAQAWQQTPQAQSLPLDALGSLADNITDAERAQMTAADFMAMRAVECLSPFCDNSVRTIPFTPAASKNAADINAGELRLQIADAMIEHHVQHGTTRALGAWVLQKADSYPYGQRAEILRPWLDRLADDPAVIPIAEQYGRMAYGNMPAAQLDGDMKPEELKNFELFLQQLRNWTERFAKDPQCASLRNLLQSLTAAEARVDMTSQYLCNSDVKGTIRIVNAPEVWGLLYKAPDNNQDGTALKQLLGQPLVKAVEAAPDGSFSFGTLPAGRYAVVPSLQDNAAGIPASLRSNGWVNVFSVSNLVGLTLSSAAEGGNTWLYVADARDMAPVEGAAVQLYKRTRNTWTATQKLTTDRNGRIIVPQGDWKAVVTAGGSTINSQLYVYPHEKTRKDTRCLASVFTDLPVYHPGDTLGFAVVGWEVADNRLSLSRNVACKITLLDANGRETTSTELTLDDSGRASGRLAVPRSGLLGHFTLRAERNGTYAGSTSLQVADYRQPTFFVQLDQPQVDTKSDSITLAGLVETYAGMPLAGSEVNLTVTWRQWWRGGRNRSNASWSTDLSAGADGRFDLTLPLAYLNGEYDDGVFEVSATSVSANGETAASQPLRFTLGNYCTVTADIPQVTEVKGNSIRWKIGLSDMLGAPKAGEISYTLTDEDTGKTIAEGSVQQPWLELKAADVPSGRYTITLAARGDTTSRSDFHTVVWREKDKALPYATPLWTPRNEITCPDHASDVTIRAGGSYKNDMILCVTSCSDGTESVRWIKSNGQLNDLHVQSPKSNQRSWVYLAGMHMLDGAQARVALLPAEAKKTMTAETVTWRDRLTPGTKERVSFRFFSPGDDRVNALAVMTDKALDAIAPFQWSMSPQSYLNWTNPVRISRIGGAYGQNNSYSLSSWRTEKVSQWEWPGWNFYGHNLYDGGSRYYTMSTKLMSRSDGVKMNGMMKEEATVDYDSVEDMAEAAPTAGTDNGMPQEPEQQQPMRGLEHPLAFFRPDLKADADGSLEISFDVPDFNTTWAMQLLGYDEQLYTASLSCQAVASRPVMASLNAPRFLRTGDRTQARATLFNNTDSTSMIGGRMAWIDAVTGRVLSVAEFEAERVGAHGSRTVSILATVPADVQALYLRAWASDANHTDGEQAFVPVYPATSAVTEADTFYLNPQQAEWSAQLNPITEGAVRTLQYCDNPTWLCVQSLPAIMTPDDASVTAKADALFANATAAGLAARFPKLREAIELWQRQNLESPLQRDGQLKTVAFECTPWVDDAAGETLRMSRLHTLLDSAENSRTLQSLLTGLADMQCYDGGWSWCPQMPSSPYMTRRVLDRLAFITGNGYLPEADIKAMADRAVNYCDSIETAAYKRRPSAYSLTGLLQYLNARQQLCKADKGTTAWRELQAKAIKAIAAAWKTMGIYDKATAAMVLWRSGDRQTPARILESLRQFATVSTDKGAWFANLNSGPDGQTPLLATARVLEAYALSAPTDKMVDQLRQGLVLSRQTMDWGRMSATAAVTSALLSCGTDWTATVSPAQISIDGVTVEVQPYEALSGTVTLPLPAAAKQVNITRQGTTPAWGGIITQSVMPVADVKAQSSEGLSVARSVAVLDGDLSVASHGQLNVGDRVKMTLFLNADRDMDYVALTDELPACLTPARQTSGYENNDGLWAYREARASKVSFFFTFLPKGQHVVNYDCYVTQAGTYAEGIATAQSQYAPMITPHSEGAIITSHAN